MLVYNTLTNKKEELKTVHPGEVRMYSCGPTVYNFAHIGNLRTYVFMDLLRRTLKLNGYKILGVMNITDVGHLTSDADEGEDKMEKAAKQQKKSPLEIAAYYTSVFEKDVKALNISLPEIVPKATDHIEEMIEFVKTFIWVVGAVVLFLIQKGLSSRKVVWLGSIMPVLTIISGGTLIWYMKWEISVRTVLPFVLLFVLFTITWLSERATLKKSRSKEDIHGISD